LSSTQFYVDWDVNTRFFVVTVKSRMHVAEKHEKKLGLVEGLTTIVDQEGYAGLYKGKP